MKIIEDRTCVRFVQKTDEHSDWLRIISGQGCWSYVGRVGGEQLLSLAPACLRTGVIAHEIMHALGFFHEHSRPDRGEYITGILVTKM